MQTINVQFPMQLIPNGWVFDRIDIPQLNEYVLCINCNNVTVVEISNHMIYTVPQFIVKPGNKFSELAIHEYFRLPKSEGFCIKTSLNTAMYFGGKGYEVEVDLNTGVVRHQVIPII